MGVVIYYALFKFKRFFFRGNNLLLLCHNEVKICSSMLFRLDLISSLFSPLYVCVCVCVSVFALSSSLPLYLSLPPPPITLLISLIFYIFLCPSYFSPFPPIFLASCPHSLSHTHILSSLLSFPFFFYSIPLPPTFLFPSLLFLPFPPRYFGVHLNMMF